MHLVCGSSRSLEEMAGDWQELPRGSSEQCRSGLEVVRCKGHSVSDNGYSVHRAQPPTLN
jgi:hypothetical protein